jgi:hypothetical protein
VTGSSGQPPALPAYLAGHGFGPHPGHGTWFDHDTGRGIIRVVFEPGEETQLISLAPASICQYKVLFSPGTPDTVIIAALEAALTPCRPPGAGPAPGSRAGLRRPGAIPDGTCQRKADPR